jgi:hypothetical protein
LMVFIGARAQSSCLIEDAGFWRMRPERHEEAADAAALCAQLRHVYWIGGGSGAGKSVIARRMAARHVFICTRPTT